MRVVLLSTCFNTLLRPLNYCKCAAMLAHAVVLLLILLSTHCNMNDYNSVMHTQATGSEAAVYYSPTILQQAGITSR